MAFWSWSRTAASNSTADSSINWAEGQAPSSVNDSARAMMARTAEYRDDVAGAITTGGTATAYTLTSFQVFDTLPHMSGQMIAFTPHTTNGATVTLNVDSLGAKPLRSAPSVELLAGTLIQGTPYVATYNNSDAAWYLQGFYGNAYNIPLGSALPFFLTTAPNSAFVLPFGQAISRTTYATLFASMSTTFGIGDGSTTFNLPDLRGRVLPGNDAMGGSAAGRLTGLTFSPNATSLGSISSGANQGEMITLTAAQIPSITSANASQAISVTTSQKVVNGPNQGSAVGGGTQVTAADSGSGGALSTVSSSGSNSISVTSNNTSGSSHGNVQPSIICNYIMRVI